MPLIRPLRTLFAAAGIALTLGGAALAQEAVDTEEGAVATEVQEGVLDAGSALRQDATGPTGLEEGTVVPVEEIDDSIALEGEALVTEDGAVPVDALGATEEEVLEGGAPDASGNMAEDASPGFNVVDAATVGEPAVAADLPVIGQPVPNGINWQPSVTDTAIDSRWLDTTVNWIILVIVLFVTGLLLWVIYRFNERRNRTAAQFTHNSPLEITWTIVPIVILVFIGAFSLPVLFNQQEIPEGDVYITVTGRQWFWSYEYPEEAIAFDSYMIGYSEGNLNPEISAELAERGFTDAHFKLATDQPVVVPVGATVVVTVTGGDVIHAWTVPAFGVKQDAVPGRLAQLWFNAEVEGVYFGQCSELCGKDHAFMPIEVRVVSPEAYAAWVAQAREEFPAG